jgi:predicted nucleotidyltransferase
MFLLVVEGGSRAYNSHHINSDLNLRGIYIGKEENYLSVWRPP